MSRSIILSISGKDVLVPSYLWDALEGPRSAPEKYLLSDGCTLGPDVLQHALRFFRKDEKPVILFPACWIHDTQYKRIDNGDLGGDWPARRRADWILARNLFRLCRLQDISRTGASSIATIYWIAVRLYGAGSFTFDELQEPVSRFQRWREIALLFMKPPDFFGQDSSE